MSLPADHLNRMARVKRALQGLSLGDGFGECVLRDLGWSPSAIDQRLLPMARWRFTDDTVMAICVAETLERFGTINPDVLAMAFARRYLEDPARGYGRGAHAILGGILRGIPWRRLSAEVFDGSGSMGNGAAMRVAPVGAYFADDLGKVVRHAAASAEPTHLHPDGKAGSIAIAVAAALTHGDDTRGMSGDDLLATVIDLTPDGPTRDGLLTAELLGLDADVREAASLLGTGRQVIASDTVPFCVWVAARNLGQFETAMWETVSGLGDCDTTCAIVGGIVSGSVETLPSEWLARREPLPDPLYRSLHA